MVFDAWVATWICVCLHVCATAFLYVVTRYFSFLTAFVTGHENVYCKITETLLIITACVWPVSHARSYWIFVP